MAKKGSTPTKLKDSLGGKSWPFYGVKGSLRSLLEPVSLPDGGCSFEWCFMAIVCERKMLRKASAEGKNSAPLHFYKRMFENRQWSEKRSQ